MDKIEISKKLIEWIYLIKFRINLILLLSPQKSVCILYWNFYNFLYSLPGPYFKIDMNACILVVQEKNTKNDILVCERSQPM